MFWAVARHSLGSLVREAVERQGVHRHPRMATSMGCRRAMGARRPISDGQT